MNLEHPLSLTPATKMQNPVCNYYTVYTIHWVKYISFDKPNEQYRVNNLKLGKVKADSSLTSHDIQNLKVAPGRELPDVCFFCFGL